MQLIHSFIQKKKVMTRHYGDLEQRLGQIANQPASKLSICGCARSHARAPRERKRVLLQLALLAINEELAPRLMTNFDLYHLHKVYHEFPCTVHCMCRKMSLFISGISWKLLRTIVVVFIVVLWHLCLQSLLYSKTHIDFVFVFIICFLESTNSITLHF